MLCISCLNLDCIYARKAGDDFAGGNDGERLFRETELDLLRVGSARNALVNYPPIMFERRCFTIR